MYLMYRKVLIGGVTAAAIVGAGGTALAISGSDSTSGKPSPTATTAPGGGKHGDKAGKHKGKGKLLRRLEHAQITVKGKDGAITHNLILGSVTAVLPTSITVQAADKVSQTFVVTKDTKFAERSGEKGKKPTTSSIAKIAKGDHVFVSGTGTSKVEAKRVVEVPAK